LRSFRFIIVDVFTDTPLAGNQLGIFSNASGMSETLMQRLAAELNFSETVFVLPAEQGGDFRMRIFTPRCEVPFAGHPTLGAAFALAGPLQSSLVRIETPVGVVPVTLEREGARVVFGRMRQPVPKIETMGSASEELLEAMGVSASMLPVDIYDNGVRHACVMLSTFDEVAALDPDLGWLNVCLEGAAVMAFALDGNRVKARGFAPGVGVPEDAATGSGAGPVALHLSRYGRIEWGEEITISQGDEIGRPSTLYAAAFGSAAKVLSVEVGGSAVVVARGEFAV
jgi:trans-2,3-dihydro-3-hydroxyanthranilate isomerase